VAGHQSISQAHLWPGQQFTDACKKIQSSATATLPIPGSIWRRQLPSRFSERYPEFSTDGRWLAYSSDESGQQEVYVRTFPDTGRKWPISSQGGGQPIWARDGRKIYYCWKDQAWVVDVRTDGEFSAGNPRPLFAQPGFLPHVFIPGWDLSLDGNRFLLIKREERKPRLVTEMILVQNWIEELNRFALTGRK
jgi:hypothetical protein